MLNIFKLNKKIIITIVIIVFIIILIIFEFLKNNNSETLNIENLNEEITIVPEDTTKKEIKKIIVHITGCIQNPGIVELEENSRIIDVINKAGGLTEDADISKVNLAYIVKDAQKIYIPSIYDLEEIAYVTSDSGDNVLVEDKFEGGNAMINLNSATQTELEQLPGIGASTALKIINFRNENGNFKSIEDIKNVPGIGNAKYESIKDMICT